MNVIVCTLSRNQTESLRGFFFDAIEYYFYCKNFNDTLQLYIFYKNSRSIPLVHQTIRDRYTIKCDYTNIHFLHMSQYKNFILKKFNKLIFFDMTTTQLIKSVIPNVNKICYITELTDKKRWLPYKRVEYFSEMPFCYADKRIKLKFFFDIYKEIDNFEPYLYVNYPKGPIREVLDLVPQTNFFTKQSSYYTNLHTKFNKYLYIKSPYWFDTHPRLFHESFFYGKEINYINKLNIRDGSWYRYYDLKENGLRDRILNKDDVLVREIIDE